MGLARRDFSNRSRPRDLVLETTRLTLRRLTPADAPFILELLNDPSFVRYIGDKGVRTREDAVGYITAGPIASYERHGFGLFLVELKEGRVPIGICGLLKRDWLEDVDVGFAFLPRFWSQGYARESASAVLDFGRDRWRLARILAITSPDNVASIGLLTKVGFRLDRVARWPDERSEIKVFALDTSTRPGGS
ncbi:MAG TPA: GNAT family N-acetyltransferase [Vicinamibacterales bacterium]|nr:GNAT family N-acetyltransferase [Vicinamibacterales bacterium]